MMREYCYHCDADVEYSIKELMIDTEIKDVVFSYLAKIAYCNDCGEEIYISELSDENVKSANKIYRELKGLIQVNEIENLLIKYNIGRKPLSSLLGWGETTIIRYLNGLTPTREYSETLRKLMNSQNMLDLYHTNKGALTPVSKRKLYARLMELLDHGQKSSHKNKLVSVAEYFLNKIEPEAGESITPLKLQKLVYYAQAWSLTFHKSLFEEDFQAWVHGPVIPDLYIYFKEYGSSNIPKVSSFDPGVFEKDELTVLDLVWSVYGKYDAKYLERLTHIEKPWVDARTGIDQNERCTNIISKEAIQQYFSDLRKNHDICSEYSLNKYVSNITFM
ncbi:type II toxin-antitoxin system antitoxin SocA domain-containing protein [Desulfosporosinus sp. FKB]|uniref:type II toxin-antitoxin system antitoxin SocA domain-containing protein n=1 Tax=Desulfosporosinus sp. FKB TaxID=1969835 RepID=UPI000B49EB9F|nr:type II toxin-antitoxin system antitoxin SocA domain-containing protein [Desulfosporosinus sp. FKB]